MNHAEILFVHMFWGNMVIHHFLTNLEDEISVKGVGFVNPGMVYPWLLSLEIIKGALLIMWFVHKTHFLSNKCPIKTHELMHHAGLPLFVHQTESYN